MSTTAMARPRVAGQPAGAGIMGFLNRFKEYLLPLSAISMGAEILRNKAPLEGRFLAMLDRMQNSVDRMAALIAGASFVIGVDTGLIHLAAALGVPLVAIFTASEPFITYRNSTPACRWGLIFSGGKS